MLCTIGSFTLRSRAGPMSSAFWMSIHTRLSGSPRRCHSKLTDPLTTRVMRLASLASVTKTSLIFSSGSVLAAGEGGALLVSAPLSGAGLSPGWLELSLLGPGDSSAGKGCAVATAGGLVVAVLGWLLGAAGAPDACMSARGVE